MSHRLQAATRIQASPHATMLLSSLSLSLSPSLPPSLLSFSPSPSLQARAHPSAPAAGRGLRLGAYCGSGAAAHALLLSLITAQAVLFRDRRLASAQASLRVAHESRGLGIDALALQQPHWPRPGLGYSSQRGRDETACGPRLGAHNRRAGRAVRVPPPRVRARHRDTDRRPSPLFSADRKARIGSWRSLYP